MEVPIGFSYAKFATPPTPVIVRRANPSVLNGSRADGRYQAVHMLPRSCSPRRVDTAPKPGTGLALFDNGLPQTSPRLDAFHVFRVSYFRRPPLFTGCLRQFYRVLSSAVDQRPSRRSSKCSAITATEVAGIRQKSPNDCGSPAIHRPISGRHRLKRPPTASFDCRLPR